MLRNGANGIIENDGTYLNPILPGDFSDIDCIRVGDDYYAITSTFQFSPDMKLMYSTDFVNWKIVGGAVDDLTHHGTGDWGGREASLLPVTWIDGWPVIGRPDDKNIGLMQWKADKPALKPSKADYIGSETFDSKIIKPHFQWNYQPRSDCYSLTDRKGWLRLKAFRPIEKGNLMKAGNTLSHRVIRFEGAAEIKMDIFGMTDGQVAGICHFSQNNSYLGVRMRDGRKYLEFKANDSAPVSGPEITKKTIWLKSEWDRDGKSHYYYSFDGKNFKDFGDDYQLAWGNYRGDRVGVFCFNDETDTGYVDIDFFKNR